MTDAGTNILENVGVVAIGRNEGARLERCVESLQRVFQRVIYVDSGSSDGSVAYARDNGVSVVELDMSVPFTAGRARDAGFSSLLEIWPDTEYVQFIDGDCEIAEHWCELAVRFLHSRPEVGIVTGWLRERFRNASVYNMMCDLEWNQPSGEIEACGGIHIIRVSSYRQAGGFNPNVIAAEDDELCIRVRRAGWKIHRLDAEMASHDAAMTRFGEWWRRSVRAGHGYAQVGHLHKDYFVSERRRAWFWGAMLPGAAIGFAPVTSGMSLALFSLIIVSFIRTRKNLNKSGIKETESTIYAKYLTISKYPNLIGMLKYWYKYALRRDMKIIEYK